MQYDIKLTPDDNDTLLVTFPDFPDAVTFGEDEQDAIFQAQNALTEVIAARIANRGDIPEPKKRKGWVRVPLSALTEAKLLLYWEMRLKNVHKAELARRLGYNNNKMIDRILDVRHNSTFEQMSNAYAALGVRMTVQKRNVA